MPCESSAGCGLDQGKRKIARSCRLRFGRAIGSLGLIPDSFGYRFRPRVRLGGPTGFLPGDRSRSMAGFSDSTTRQTKRALDRGPVRTRLRTTSFSTVADESVSEMEALLLFDPV